MIATSKDIPLSWRNLLEGIQVIEPTAVIAGGALRDRDNGRQVKDLDIFVEGDSERELRALRTLLTERGYSCSEIKSEDLYPIAQGEVVGFFSISDPLIRPEGATDDVQIIMVRWSTQDIVSRFDFGICQIAFDGEAVVRSAHYLVDRAHHTFTIVRERRDEALEASVERFARLSSKYPGWRFKLGLALHGLEDEFSFLQAN